MSPRRQAGDPPAGHPRGDQSVRPARATSRVRDRGFCRQRLRPVLDSLQADNEPVDSAAEVYPESTLTPYASPLVSAEGYWEAIRESATARVVLPEGQKIGLRIDLQESH